MDNVPRLSGFRTLRRTLSMGNGGGASRWMDKAGKLSVVSPAEKGYNHSCFHRREGGVMKHEVTSLQTKKLLAGALKTCMETKPLSKVTVNELIGV